MSEAASAPAPSTSAPAPTNGASSPSQPPPPTSGIPSPKPNSGTRAPDGRFLPKTGTVGVVAQEEKTPQATAQEVKAEEARKLRVQLKRRGQVEDWEGTEADVQREIQQGREAAAQLQEMKRKLAEREKRDALLKEKPDEYLREAGVDVDRLAAERIKHMLELETMNEDQRRAYSAEQERDALKAEKAEREAKQKALKRDLLTKQARQQRITSYAAAIKASGLQPTKALILRMAQAEAFVRDEEGRHDFTPEELAKEALRTAKEDAKSYLDGLTAEQLVSELGPKRLQALLDYTVAQFEASAGQPVAPVKQQEAPPSAPKQQTYMDEEDMNKRIEELRSRAKPR